jgi:hypothetical protein
MPPSGMPSGFLRGALVSVSQPMTKAMNASVNTVKNLAAVGRKAHEYCVRCQSVR